jgi:hypothetical protein
LPLYGRNLQKPAEAKAFREIDDKWNPASEADEVGNFYFNGPSTIRRKTELALQMKLGGVMVWELGQDATGDKSLLRAIRASLDKSRP